MSASFLQKLRSVLIDIMTTCACDRVILTFPCKNTCHQKRFKSKSTHLLPTKPAANAHGYLTKQNYQSTFFVARVPGSIRAQFWLFTYKTSCNLYRHKVSHSLPKMAWWIPLTTIFLKNVWFCFVLYPTTCVARASRRARSHQKPHPTAAADEPGGTYQKVGP